ncbi:DUF4336 domain-containing protein [Maritimibacter sp. UBA3975]|uniref:DUF4336 domain-containing protein n=1 Tax=Maritimibacter sp. UBA3975 TaxID=1946833 RepID=UPI000C0A4A9C|nr:DUF4336 domain-containing protein [Maritimibacter sp. UBA3975]MAM63544.1 hypothetical protein [Maritimibacter sp.]|tara:strand:- start:62889 stop:63581 length:693 start_codon:yes stop_codon:yes gene_type:complete
MLDPFGQDIWLVNGPEVVAAMGFRYPTRMAIVRLENGDLWVWSPVALEHGLKWEIDNLGPVRHIVAPNSLHHVFLSDWAKAYPDARLYAAPGLAEKRKDLRFAAKLGDAPEAEWGDEIAQVALTDNRITTEVVFFHRASATVLFTDLLQQLPVGWFKGWRAIVARLDGMVGLEPGVPKKFRVAFTDKDKTRGSVRRILSWPVHAVVIAHGAPVTTDGRAFLKRAFAWLDV